MATVSVIIPTMNASAWLSKQLKALHTQTKEISEIVIVDSQSEDDTCSIATNDTLCRVISIRRGQFDHGGTRDYVARLCQSDYLWFLTQDAIPANADCLQNLINATQRSDIACAYGRQITANDTASIEKLNRLMNYPEQSFERSAKDIPSLHIRAFFLSNTCCLYKRNIYLRCGGFQHYLPTNEDMLMAATFLRKGYSTAYCAEALVWHAHHMSISQWYRRSFDQGAFFEMYQSAFRDVDVHKEGLKYATNVLYRLLTQGHFFSMLHFSIICLFRYLGNRHGHQYTKLSKRAILNRTQNQTFWQTYLNDHSSAYTIDFE